ncbi:MAG: T9SS type A sorting domain-containing protein [Bacteroidales bacterium]|nr:T9SS type A sorting domain-containing protein [Bacteroidales bacterium]
MKKILLITITLALLSVQLFSQCADPSNIYTFTYNGKNYEIVKEMKNWTDAATCAVERGGYLLEINNNNEQNAVYDSILNGAGILPTYTTIANGGGIAYLWIGATDQLNEGEWLWDGNNDGIGTNFWNGQGANGAGNGMPVGNAFSYWGGYNTSNYMEPDNYGAGQDHAAIGLAGWPSGTTMLGAPGEWNDIIGTSLLYFVIEIDDATDVKNDIFNDKLEIYPNPVKESYTINFENPDNKSITLEVYNSRGLIVQKQNDISGNQVTVSVSELSKGMYVFRLKNEEKCYFGKFVVD